MVMAHLFLGWWFGHRVGSGGSDLWLAAHITAASQVFRECGEHAFDDRRGLLDALAGFAVGVAVPGDEVLQGELVDPVVVFGLDPVGVGLAVVRRFWLSRISGAAYAACVENSRLSRMNG
jgi:hypothetical protein